MFVIAFVLLVVAGAIFLVEFVRANWAPWSMLGFALQAFALALWLYKATGDLDGAFK